MRDHKPKYQHVINSLLALQWLQLFSLLAAGAKSQPALHGKYQVIIAACRCWLQGAELQQHEPRFITIVITDECGQLLYRTIYITYLGSVNNISGTTLAHTHTQPRTHMYKHNTLSPLAPACPIKQPPLTKWQNQCNLRLLCCVQDDATSCDPSAPLILLSRDTCLRFDEIPDPTSSRFLHFTGAGAGECWGQGYRAKTSGRQHGPRLPHLHLLSPCTVYTYGRPVHLTSVLCSTVYTYECPVHLTRLSSVVQCTLDNCPL